MRFGRLMRSAAVLAVAPVAVAGLAVSPANAHGTLGDPVSRIAACYAEGPESPQSQMCIRLVEENGTQPLYDWHEVNIANADGQHREIIPDGQLCSAGRDKYSALDNPGDWASTAVTSLPSGGDHTFEYTAAVPHAGYIEYYVTTDDWDPSTPLTWAELESEPFAVDDQPVAENGDYTMTAELPEKSGQHLIYTIWQRTDSPEAFYSCSDVTFGGENAAVARAAEETEAFEADPAAHADIDHGHAEEHPEEAEGTEVTPETAAAQETSNSVGAGETEAEEAAAPHHDHASGEELATTGTALTWLFATAIALMVAGAAALRLSRGRRSTA
jgi:chitin-binding protein